MLKVIENGVLITLTGDASKQDGVFLFGLLLLVGAVLVALAMVFLPTKWAIGALALLVVGSFIFNHWRQQQTQQSGQEIDSGVIQLTQGQLVHQQMGKQQTIILDAQDYVELNNDQLIIYSADKQKKCQVVGFETLKEAEVAKKVLQGKTLATKNTNIKLQASE